MIEQAAKQHADLVVLGETLTYFGTGKTFAEVAGASAWTVDGVLRCTGQEARPLHCCRPGLVAWPSDL